jgi:hypothetical protein
MGRVRAYRGDSDYCNYNILYTKITTMKEALKKVFDKRVLAVAGVLIIFVLVFEYVVFPGLTVADTYINVLSFIVGLISISFIYHYIQWEDLIDFIVGKKEVVPPGETELDYLPKEEVVKKKPTRKRSTNKKQTTKKVVTETKK